MIVKGSYLFAQFFLPKDGSDLTFYQGLGCQPNYVDYNRDAKKYQKNCKYTASMTYIAHLTIANCRKGDNSHITKDSEKEHYENDEDRKK